MPFNWPEDTSVWRSWVQRRPALQDGLRPSDRILEDHSRLRPLHAAKSWPATSTARGVDTRFSKPFLPYGAAPDTPQPVIAQRPSAQLI